MRLEASESFGHLLLPLGRGDYLWATLRGMVQRRCRVGYGRFLQKLDRWYRSGLYLKVFQLAFPILHKRLSKLVCMEYSCRVGNEQS